MKPWSDRSWNSPDGLRLHYRDYDGPHDRPPILCIPGLTRNSRDFEPLAEHFAGDWRLIAVDLRGRGLSESDPNPMNYLPQTYAGDLIKLLDQLGIADAVFIGTSLGGIVTMVTAMQDSERIAGALLNDIGPRVEPVGIERIRSYVGKDVSFASWERLRALRNLFFSSNTATRSPSALAVNTRCGFPSGPASSLGWRTRKNFRLRMG